jgi:DNA-binding NarL/FixJ family response regulator
LKILIADDHPLLRRALSEGLASLSEDLIILEAGSGKELREVAKAERPELVLLDVDLGDENGSAIVPELARLIPAVSIMIVTGRPMEVNDCALEVSNVAGIVDKKDIDIEQLRAMAAETLKIDAKDQGKQATLNKKEREAGVGEEPQMPERLKAVFLAMGQGKTTKEIAAELKLSKQTIESYRKEIAQIVGESGSALIRLAVLYSETARERQE